MNSDRLTGFITNPDSLRDTDTPYLEGMIKEFPYFQMAHVLLLYNLKKYNSEKFDQQLQESAIHIPDRRKLYNLLYQYPAKKVDTTDENYESQILSDEPIEFQFGDVKPAYTIDEPVDKKQIEDEVPSQELLEIEDIASETVSVEPKTDPCEVSEKPGDDLKEDSGTSIGFTLIDKFIEENPAFTPNKLVLDETRDDISVPSVQEDDTLVTETLATIFEMQKLYEKAITVYEKLILKFPEKSTYFASRISELKKNIK
jgi:hypothetical protein